MAGEDSGTNMKPKEEKNETKTECVSDEFFVGLKIVIEWHRSRKIMEIRNRNSSDWYS